MVGVDMVFSLIRRREALVYNPPNDHVTRDIREGIVKFGYLQFKLLGSAGLEAEASSGSVLGQTAEMTANVLRKCKVSLFLIDASEATSTLGFGDPVALFAETGTDETNEEESKLPLQLAFVGRPNVGNSTLLNAILQEECVLVGPEASLTRDSVRVEFKFEGRTIYMVDTAGWLQRTKSEKVQVVNI
ncbi:putative GTP binding domain, P-loop containing nucleoside triphosphate hydrolase [Helianthus anomalus]